MICPAGQAIRYRCVHSSMKSWYTGMRMMQHQCCRTRGSGQGSASHSQLPAGRPGQPGCCDLSRAARPVCARCHRLPPVPLYVALQHSPLRSCTRRTPIFSCAVAGDAIKWASCASLEQYMRASALSCCKGSSLRNRASRLTWQVSADGALHGRCRPGSARRRRSISR